MAIVFGGIILRQEAGKRGRKSVSGEAGKRGRNNVSGEERA
jgi:hypothetical protein